jgi:serine/threonine protein phosphatase 1
MTKTWVIPDIHGCAETLKTLIEFQVKPNKNDHLIFVGDYIDRGPDSKGVIDFIMSLQKNDYKITVLKGNHEDYCIKAWEDDRRKKSFLGFSPKSNLQKEWERFGGKQTMESFGASRAREIPERYIRWMKELEYYLVLDKFVVVHAGLNFKIDDPFKDKRAMLWSRDYNIDPEKIGFRRVVHGHLPVNLEFIDMVVKNKESYWFIDIDNGIYITQKAGYGNLLALNLDKMEYLVQSLMDEINYKGI